MGHWWNKYLTQRQLLRNRASVMELLTRRNVSIALMERLLKIRRRIRRERQLRRQLSAIRLEEHFHDSAEAELDRRAKDIESRRHGLKEERGDLEELKAACQAKLEALLAEPDSCDEGEFDDEHVETCGGCRAIKEEWEAEEEAFRSKAVE